MGSAMPVAMMMGQMIMGAQEAEARRKQAKQAQKGAQEMWEKHAYPTEERVKAARTTGQTTLSLAREKAEERIPAALAARGFGPESGLMLEEYGGVEAGYAKALGEFESDITTWAETPGMEMPSAMFPSDEFYSGTESLQQALGMMTSMSMYQSMYGGGGYNPYLAYQVNEPSLQYQFQKPNYQLMNPELNYPGTPQLPEYTM